MTKLHQVYRNSKVSHSHVLPSFHGGLFGGDTSYDHFKYNQVTTQEHLQSFLEFDCSALDKMVNLKHSVEESLNKYSL